MAHLWEARPRADGERLFLFPSSSLGEPVLKPELGNEEKDRFEILASSLERQRVSAVAGGKLELPGQGVPKLELGNEGKETYRNKEPQCPTFMSLFLDKLLNDIQNI
ncbi:MAG: hypothetical protein SWC40_00975 [Thermodesulfobacteriota bacterium]|nr:hypothetical protein [Thermodesulfobacteriota bacterium]